jgi:solute carrier family 50 protein (sugar transporter)
MGVLLQHVVPALGVLVANALFLSPLRPVLAARRQGALGALNPLVFASMTANCAAWLVYACLRRDPYILASNLLGGLLAQFMLLACVGAADASVPGERAAREAAVRAWLFFGGVLAASGAAVAFSGVALERAARLWGFVAVAILLVFYASPLSALARVLRARSSAALQRPLALATAASGALWAAYGLAVADAFVWAPNVAGLIFGLVQVALCVAYPPTPTLLLPSSSSFSLAAGSSGGGGGGGGGADALAAAAAGVGSSGAGLLQPRPPSSAGFGMDAAEKGGGGGVGGGVGGAVVARVPSHPHVVGAGPPKPAF